MAFPVLKKLFTLSIFLFICALQVDCKVENYALNVVENGTSVDEEVEVDEEEQTEVIRVPKHGDIDALELLNDFIGGFSARRDPDNKVCYVSKLDSSFPSPKEMKQEMDKISNQSQPTEVTTETSEWKVVGLADRSDLPSKILDFCGTFPIYEIEENENPSDDTAVGQDSGKTRRKRSTCYNLCSYSDLYKRSYCARRGYYYSCYWKCQYYRYYCYYRIRCYSWGCIRYRYCYRICYQWCKAVYCPYYG